MNPGVQNACPMKKWSGKFDSKIMRSVMLGVN